MVRVEQDMKDRVENGQAAAAAEVMEVVVGTHLAHLHPTFMVLVAVAAGTGQMAATAAYMAAVAVVATAVVVVMVHMAAVVEAVVEEQT